MIDSPKATAIWDEVEHGSYRADLELWAELASGRDPILDLGCGTGRVALPLARLGHAVWALDHEPALTGALAERAATAGLDVRAIDADARSLRLDAGFGLILAPMQFAHLFDAGDRAAILACVCSHLLPDGAFAAALLDAPVDRPETWETTEDVLLPDVRERDGWIFSSLPLSVVADDTGFTVERLRQTVSPTGGLTDERHSVHLHALDPERFEAEAIAAGLAPLERRRIAQTDDHVGSTVVIVRRPGPDAGPVSGGAR